MATQARKPLDERAKLVIQQARKVVKAEYRRAKAVAGLQSAEDELRTARRFLRDLMADPATLGSDGQNVGDLGDWAYGPVRVKGDLS